MSYLDKFNHVYTTTEKNPYPVTYLTKKTQVNLSKAYELYKSVRDHNLLNLFKKCQTCAIEFRSQRYSPLHINFWLNLPEVHLTAQMAKTLTRLSNNCKQLEVYTPETYDNPQKIIVFHSNFLDNYHHSLNGARTKQEVIKALQKNQNAYISRSCSKNYLEQLVVNESKESYEYLGQGEEQKVKPIRDYSQSFKDFAISRTSNRFRNYPLPQPSRSTPRSSWNPAPRLGKNNSETDNDVDEQIGDTIEEKPVTSIPTPRVPWPGPLLPPSLSQCSFRYSISGYKDRESYQARHQDYRLGEVYDFLVYILEQWNLTIGDYFTAMEQAPSFFLLAATGLGKTVGTPIFLLAKTMERLAREHVSKAPRVWVVVPTIAIASESVTGLNKQWVLFKQSSKTQRQGLKLALAPSDVLYGGRSSSFKAHYHAPIQFITTGVLPLLVKGGELDPQRDIVLLDEAHKTLTVSEAMEHALSRLWHQGITYHCMSATVDTEDLEQRLKTRVITANQERYPKYWHLSRKELTDTVLEVIENFHIHRNYDHPMFPPTTYPHRVSVLAGTDPKGLRASGILVVVDSFNGDASDARELRQAIEPICHRHGIAILGFASSIRDDDEANRVHQDQFEQVITQHQPYVIITTNVIEMGITWSTLDVVITKSTEITNKQIGGYTLPMKVPISSAALLQRGGRVGRKRPGIVVISTGLEQTSQFARLTDTQLNTNGLPIEKLSYPLQTLEPYLLGYELARAGILSLGEIEEYLRRRYFPSIDNLLELSYVASMSQPIAEMYDTLGITANPKYQAIVPYYERWVGDPIYPWLLAAGKLLIEVREDYPKTRHMDLEVYFTVVYIGFMSTIPTSKIVAKDGVDFDRLRLPFSDLLSIAWKNELTYEFNLEKTVEFVEEIFRKYSTTWKKGKSSRDGLKLHLKSKAEVQFYEFFVELLDHLEKKDYQDERFYHFFDEGRLIDAEEDWDSLDSQRIFEQAFSIDTKTNFTYLYRKLVDELKLIYRAIGTPFTIDYDVKSPRQNQYILTYEFKGETVHESVDGGYHFVDIDTTKTYWGIIMPSTVRDQTQIVLRMEHWFYEPVGIVSPMDM